MVEGEMYAGAIMRFLDRTGGATWTEIHRGLSIPTGTLNTSLKTLRRAGLVEKRGGRFGDYVLTGTVTGAG